MPDAVALREKPLGLWRDVTWADYWDRAQLVGHALLALGLEPGDRVAVHAENRPAWVFTDYGTQAARGICVGLYPTNPAAEVGYILRDCGARILIAEDQEQVDKALEAGELPTLERIVYLEPRGVRGYDDPRLMGWADFLELGAQHREAHPEALAARYRDATADDTAVLVYTSGTTGPPKGAMISVGNVEWIIEHGGGKAGIIQPPPSNDDVFLSYLPLCHVYERLLTAWLALDSGAQVHFAESIETVQSDLREVQPTIFASVPRILEKMAAGVQVRMASASRVKRANFALWSRVAQTIGRRLVANHGSHDVVTRVLYGLGWVFLFRALKRRLGLAKCRHAVSGAAAIAPEILEWFMGIGVPMVEAYGQTESTAVLTTNHPGRVHLGTVGEPLEALEIRLDETTGEILARGGNVFQGYWGQPDTTMETIDTQGWLHTGDVGEWVDGRYLKIVDRIKDIIITSGGKNISPSEIENSLKTSPYVKEAVVIGEGRKFLSALVGIDQDVVGNWAQARGIAYTTYRDLTTKPEVVTLVQRAVDDTNARFARVEQIKKFRLLPKELDHEQGEVTATQKVKRGAINDAFAALIDDMYAGRSPDLPSADHTADPSRAGEQHAATHETGGDA
jgi:long-chain acyl-CoA synthetase